MFKIILTTIGTTIAVTIFTMSIFINSILNTFGLATVSLEKLVSFQQSKQVIQQLKTKNEKHKQKNKQIQADNTKYKSKIDAIKKRHKSKKLNISRKFVERSGKKITSSAISAATIGTAGVVLTVAGLEVYDYCEDKAVLLNDENILFDTNEEFDYARCLKNAQEDSAKIITLIQETAPEMVVSAWEDTKVSSKKVANEFDNMWREIKGFGKDKWSTVYEWVPIMRGEQHIEQQINT